MTSLEPALRFLDHRAVRWGEVRRARYLVYQRFHYRYPGPIRDLHHRLVVLPAARYGDQLLCHHNVRVVPEVEVRSLSDPFGNCVLEFRASHVPKDVSFEVVSEIEREVVQKNPPVTPGLTSRGVDFLEPTPLTTPDARLLEVTRHLKEAAADERDLASRISCWVYGAMRYGFGSTGVKTSAAEALTAGRGLCQDYAHIMLALCRAAGLRARYVSGHMLAEGGSHAWVEVLLREKGEAVEKTVALAFDPTNDRCPDLSYVTVAVGRDYHDVAPTSGSFNAPYAGEMAFTKRAGLTALEYADGRVLKST